MFRRAAIVCAAVVALAGCTQPKTAQTAPHSRNLITADEIATINVSDAYEVVDRLRPTFLSARGALTPPVTYVDGLPFGDLQSLHRIQPSSVASIQYLDPMMATQRYGKAAGGGAILVTTKH
jgi:hypothetical protein